MSKQSAHLQSETNEGTDRPWERPGQAAQEPHAKIADAKTREREYEDSVGAADVAAYQQTSSSAAPVSPVRPRTSSIVGEEGRVGDPLPIALLMIVAAPILLMIAAVVWWMAR